MVKLSPSAKAFCLTMSHDSREFYTYEDDEKVALSESDLAEIEEVEDWVALQAMCEEMEIEHCVALALKYTEQEKIDEIHKRIGAMAVAGH